MSKLISISLLVFIISAFGLHKYYISLTQINYVEEQKSLQLTTSVFIDDLESVLRKTYDTVVTIGETDKNLLDSLYRNYLNNHLRISIQGREIALKLLLAEEETDEVFFYIEGENIDTFTEMEVVNSMFVSQIFEQQNIIKTSINGKHKSLILNRQKTKAIFNY
jgi:hypothetical protein